MVTKSMCAGKAEQKGITNPPARPYCCELGQAEGLRQPCLVQPSSPFSPADMEQAQRSLDAEQMQQQQLKLRDRQKFFEEVFQHDVDFFFPMSHLQIEHRRRKWCRHHHGDRGVSREQ